MEDAGFTVLALERLGGLLDTALEVERLESAEARMGMAGASETETSCAGCQKSDVKDIVT